MRENFLHYIWKLKVFETTRLKSIQGESITIYSVGQHNLNSGPDFFNGKLKIDEQLWAGNIELHIKSSDWYAHHHEKDPNYDNVILHVVWEHDVNIFRKDDTFIPTLEIKKYISEETLSAYYKLFSKANRWINCENDIAKIDNFILNSWLERLYFERLERKSEDIIKLLDASTNNWDAVFFKMLTKNFGLKVNGSAFLSMANSFDFSLLRKLQNNELNLEALFFGQSGLLEKDIQEAYFCELKDIYRFIKQKYNLSHNTIEAIQFFRLRPFNFPTIRLSQLANLYYQHQSLFSKVIATKNVRDVYDLFAATPSLFWLTHYTFNTVSKKTKKQLSKSFIDLLIINTIIPIKYAYAKYQGKIIDDHIVDLIQEIKPEKNSIVKKYNSLKVESASALDTQALIQLKNEYCDKNKCLKCAIGNSLLNQ